MNELTFDELRQIDGGSYVYGSDHCPVELDVEV